MTIKSSTAQQWPLLARHAGALFRALERVGLDPSPLFAGGRISWSPSELGQGGEPPQVELVVMAREAVNHLETAAARLSGEKPPHPFQYDVMWFTTAGCTTLASAIGAIEIYSCILEGRMYRIDSFDDKPRAGMAFQRSGTERSPIIFLAELLRLVMFDRMLSWLAGYKLPDVAYELDYPAFYSRYVPQDLVSREIAWDRPRLALSFPAAIRDLRIYRRPADLEPLLPLSPILLSDTPGHSYAWKVARHFDTAITEGRELPSLPDLARLENCSPATLRRRLEAEGTTLLQVKNERRLAWAVLMIQARRNSMEQVAARLGFADETAFRRAFRQWTGSSPTAFRE